MHEILDREACSGDVVLRVLVVVFDGLDAEEDEPQQNGGCKRQHETTAVAHLRTVDAHGHCEARDDEDRRVRGAQPDAQRVRCRHEGVVMPVAVKQINHKQAAEEHDLGQQEEPHTERDSFLLLLYRLKVMAQVVRVLALAMCDFVLMAGCNSLAIQRSLPRVESYSPATRSRMLRSPRRGSL